MDHFYVTLPSNSSKDYYGKQKLNQFKTKLSHSLNMNVDDWEVGLAEIIYPMSWKNLKADCLVCVGISNLDLDVDTGKYIIHEKTFTVQTSHYMNVQDLFTKLNTRLENLFRQMKREDGHNIAAHHDKTYFGGIKEKFLNITLRYDENVGKVYLSGNNHIYIILPPQLSQMLGFGDTAALLGSEVLCPQIAEHLCHHTEVSCKTFKYPDEQYNDLHIKLLKGEYIADVNRGLTSLYIYSPIVESQLVGDTLAPLLRVVCVNGVFGQHVNVKFNNIYYLHLRSSFIDHVEVYIRDDIGNLIPFDTGRVVIILHFRKK